MNSLRIKLGHLDSLGGHMLVKKTTYIGQWRTKDQWWTLMNWICSESSMSGITLVWSPENVKQQRWSALAVSSFLGAAASMSRSIPFWTAADIFQAFADVPCGQDWRMTINRYLTQWHHSRASLREVERCDKRYVLAKLQHSAGCSMLCEIHSVLQRTVRWWFPGSSWATIVDVHQEQSTSQHNTTSKTNATQTKSELVFPTSVP